MFQLYVPYIYCKRTPKYTPWPLTGNELLTAIITFVFVNGSSVSDKSNWQYDGYTWGFYIIRPWIAGLCLHYYCFNHCNSYFMINIFLRGNIVLHLCHPNSKPTVAIFGRFLFVADFYVKTALVSLTDYFPKLSIPMWILYLTSYCMKKPTHSIVVCKQQQQSRPKVGWENRCEANK